MVLCIKPRLLFSVALTRAEVIISSFYFIPHPVLAFPVILCSVLIPPTPQFLRFFSSYFFC
jgi:hypothetical protein